jgi:hypothetical protein
VYALRHHKPRSPDKVRLWSRCDGHVDRELSSGGLAYGMPKPDSKRARRVNSNFKRGSDFPRAINMGPVVR